MTAETTIAGIARSLWGKDHPGKPCPSDQIPSPADLTAWLMEWPEAAAVEAGKRLDALLPLRNPRLSWRWEGRTDGRMVARMVASEGADRIEGPAIPVGVIHQLWLAAPKSDRPKHPLAPLVKAWQERPRHPGKATVTTAGGMLRRPEPVSTLRRTPWGDGYSLETIQIDGEPMTAKLPDLVELFPEPKLRLRRLYKPAESRLPLRVEGVREIQRDLRLVALEGLPGVLAGDVLALACLAHGIDRAMLINERDGAALLARTRDGGFRSPKPTDIKRFWQAAADLRAALMYDPHGSGRWADLAKVEPVPNRRGIILGRPTWMRYLKGDRWTLTAEGGRAGKARIVAGEGGAAGRLITGIEYRLAARWDGRPGIAPDLRPEWKGGPGHPVFIPWRDAMNLMGDVWDRADGAADYAARFRWRRMVQSLLKAGYLIHNLRGEASAGDSVEIVDVVKGGRSRPAGLRVRASARFVEAGGRGGPP